jgi:hypothetical protein
MTVDELKQILSVYPDDYPVEFQHIILPDGKHYKLNLFRIDDRGVCHFEWNPIQKDDEIKFDAKVDIVHIDGNS